MLGFAALVAGSFSLGAMVANEISPAALNAVRFALAAVILGAAALAVGPGFSRAHLAAPWRYLLLGGLFGGYFVLMFEGLKTAPPVSAAAVFTLTPAMTAGFGLVLLAQVVTPRIAIALGIGGLGALWVIFRGDLASLLALEIGRGEAVYFAGCVLHAVFTPLLRRLNRGEPALVSTALVMAGGCVVLSVFGAMDLVTTSWGKLSPLVWITLFYLAVMASAVTFFLLQIATMRLPASKVMAYTYLVPSFVIAWEVGLGHGVPPVMVIPGVGLTALALVLLLKDEDAPPRAVPRR